jgi:hypothetical protein
LPYFPEHRALFIHIPKCAGKSIENALLPGGIDADSGRRPLLNLVTRPLARSTASAIPRKYLLGTLDVALAAQHLTYIEIRMLGLLTARQLEAATVFATVRDPYARAISSISHFRERFAAEYRLDPVPRPEQVEAALEFWRDIATTDHNLLAHRRAQSDYLLDLDGSLKADRILRMESLAADFAALCEELGIAPRNLLHAGKGAVQADLAAIYTPKSRAIVQDMFARDFELLGYPS